MAGLCEQRVEYRPEAAGDASQIDSAWLAAQVCPDLPLNVQYCWFDKTTNRLYFVFRGHIGGPIVGTPPHIQEVILVNDIGEILRNDLDAQLYHEIIVE